MGKLLSRSKMKLITKVTLAAFRSTQNTINTSGFIQKDDDTTTAMYFENCVVNPIKSKELEVLPEGLRDKATYIIYTDTEVRTVHEGTDELADHVSLYGNIYKCYKSVRWTAGVRDHYKVYLVSVTTMGITSDDFIDYSHDEYTSMVWDDIDDQDTWEEYWRSD